jgi:hypothetical protein
MAGNNEVLRRRPSGSCRNGTSVCVLGFLLGLAELLWLRSSRCFAKLCRSLLRGTCYEERDGQKGLQRRWTLALKARQTVHLPSAVPTHSPFLREFDSIQRRLLRKHDPVHRRVARY